MNRLNYHIKLMHNWHRLRRKLRIRQQPDEREFEMLIKAVENQELNPNTDILLSKLYCRIEFTKMDFSCYLNVLKYQEGKVFPFLQQIENYKRSYQQYLYTDVGNPSDPFEYWFEILSNPTLHSFMPGIIRFERKFIEPMKELFHK